MGDAYDAVLLLSFGGPEKPEDVMPFLDNVLRGRNVPEERKRAVAGNYEAFGGRSPLNDQNRAFLAALRDELSAHGPRLPVYWGNRNWHPFLAHTLRLMAADGVKRALVFVTSAFSSYSGCRQYQEDMAQARAEVGEPAPILDKLRGAFNHPGLIEAWRQHLLAAFEPREGAFPVVFTAHSLPRAMAAGCAYEAQLAETARLVAQAAGVERHSIAYQSRSGPPGEPWLEPDIGNELLRVAKAGARGVVVAPIGFLSDHMEVVFDLDRVARRRAEELGLEFARAKTPGTHPRFVAAVRELILERTAGAPAQTLGSLGPLPDTCAPDCCPARVGARRP